MLRISQSACIPALLFRSLPAIAQGSSPPQEDQPKASNLHQLAHALHVLTNVLNIRIASLLDAAAQVCTHASALPRTPSTQHEPHERIRTVPAGNKKFQFMRLSYPCTALGSVQS